MRPACGPLADRLREAPARGTTPFVVDLLLASASPRRAKLLRDAGIEIEVAPVACDETAHPGEVATVYARRIAAAKLAAAPARDVPVLAADTVVWCAHPPDPLGKPTDREDARAMLTTLASVGAHRVTTAFALRAPGGGIVEHSVTTAVWFRPLTAAEIDAYLDTNEWTDKAGAYGIQGHAAGLVARIEGSYTNVVGLPVAEVVEAVRRMREAR